MLCKQLKYIGLIEQKSLIICKYGLCFDQHLFLKRFMILYTHKLDNKPFSILVSAPFLILHNTMELNVSSGSDFDFSFNMDQYFINSTATFYWQKDGHNISSGYRYKGTTTHILTLLDVEGTDKGVYSLIVIMANQNMSFNINILVGKFISVVM